MPKRSVDNIIDIRTIKPSGDLLSGKIKGESLDEGDDSTDSEESEYEDLESEEDSDDDFIKLEEKESSDNGSSEEDDDVEDYDEEDKNESHEKEREIKEERENLISEAKKKERKKVDISGNESGHESEDSNEEELRNTIGNIPVEWYNEYPHIGYDLHGTKILKPATGDELDDFLSKMDDPNYWRTVKDKQTMKEVILTDQELEMIDRMQNKQYPSNADDPYKPYIDHFTSVRMNHPLSSAPEPKRRFIPSKWEHKKIIKIVRAIRNGWIKPKKTATEKPRFYMLWDQDDSQTKSSRYKMHIPAPKVKLPGHEESYNPPPEYLPTEEEIAAWEEMDPEDRPRNFLPKKYSSLRLVPGYSNFIQERFERCLDLYLCPRQRKMRLNVNPDDLIPKLPKPKDLQPFPTTQALVYRGHKGAVRCLSVDPSGQWMISGGDDRTIRFWEVATGRCLETLQVEDSVLSVAWNPNASLTLVLAAVQDSVMVINTNLGDKLVCCATDRLISTYTPPDEVKEQLVSWTELKDNEQRHTDGVRILIKHKKIIQQVTWHGKGDYFSVVMPEGANQSVVIHQLSKRRSQEEQSVQLTKKCLLRLRMSLYAYVGSVKQPLKQPFRKSKGLIQCVRFHPIKPFLFVATQRYVRVYDLSKQELLKKLQSTAKWISSIAIHPKGDNIIIGSYDRRLCWFDMDLSTYPYKTMRHHKEAIRQVTFHSRYPLFASCSDDGSVIICHGTVFSDLMQNPLIVPVKILRGHEKVNNLSVLDCAFHPSQPWIFTSGADSTIRLYV